MISIRPEALELRKFMIRRANAHQKPGSGSFWDAARDRGIAMERLEEWDWLEQILSPIPHMVVGGLAVNLFAPPRATEDMDVAVVSADVDAVMELLRASGFDVVGPLSIGGWSVRKAARSLVVLSLDEPWALEAIQSPRLVDGVPVMDLPYLILMKMAASRATDIGDIQRMLHGASETDRARVRDVFARFAPQDLEDLDQLIRLSDIAW